MFLNRNHLYDNSYWLATGDIMTKEPLEKLIRAQHNCEEKMAHKLT